MSESSVFSLACRLLGRTILVLSGLIAFFVAMELIKAFNILFRASPVIGYGFAAILAGAVLLLGFRLVSFVMDHRTFDPPPLPDEHSDSHIDLKCYCQHLVHVLKRFGMNPLLDENLLKSLRQEAYDIDDMLGAHPLNDDLRMAIAKCHGTVLPAALGRLRERADRLARERMKLVVEDVVEPPFPMVRSLAIIRHEVGMVSDIVETYLGRPALFEHLVVLRDVRRVIVDGRFLSLGQNLFENVYANMPPIGRAISEIGPALTSIWLTRIIALAAVIRCEAQDEWDTGVAIRQLEDLTEETIASVKESLTQDVLPILKTRLRFSTREGATDSATFFKSVVEGLAKSLDALATTLKRQPAEKTSLLNRRRTVYDMPAAEETPEQMQERRTTRHSRRRRRGGIFRVLRTFGQRLKYTVGCGPDGR